MGKFKDFDLDLKQVKANIEPEAFSELNCWKTIIKTVIGASKAANCSKFYKNLYTVQDSKNLKKELINKYELRYWNQRWIKECNSFQEFAVKNRQFQKI